MRRASACRTRPAQQLPWPGRGSRKAGPGTAWRLLFALLAFGVSSCKGVPVMSHVLQGEKVWNEIDAMCSTIPARDPLSQPSNALEEFCFMVLELLQKDKEELRIPGGVQSRGYFMFRPRNGRRSAALY
ncbi:PREDICTED: neuromedin-U isoform X2 [Thamnophis sirtalis]|uniref:Neuromedin-U isoform X2 n=1 Tax=Thamnophis sirtalis TaxID=35019 RepID=A0A6I9YT19_9SAUR|nr:PREDICTED: neuromedin-U isoform X2 [Thamnophis sirtalis]